MRKLLAEAGFLQSSEVGADDTWELFDANDAAAFLDGLNHYVSALDLQAALGLDRSLFNGLRKDGFFEPTLNGPDHKPLWDSAAASAFLDRLLTGAESIYVPRHDWCGLAKAAQRLKVRPGEILNLIQTSRLKRFGKYQGKNGYDALLIPINEAERALQRPSAAGQSIELFAKTVGLRPTAAMKLIRGGHIPTTAGQNPKTKAAQRFLSPEDLAAYHARFVTLRALARHLGKSWQLLNAELTSDSIAPFSPDGMELGAIYEWDSLEVKGIVRPQTDLMSV
jgi:hypothetical protein